MDLISAHNRVYILAVIALLLLLGVGWYSWCRHQKNRHQHHTRKTIESLGLEFIRDAVLPDGLDALVFIDYLLLTPSGVLVLDVQHSDGHLFGGTAVDQWSQVVNNRTYKFSNPLYANQTKCQAVMWNVDNIRTRLADSDRESNWQSYDWNTYGWVVFSNAGNFPKGIPRQVSMIDDLAGNLAPIISNTEKISDPMRKIWNQLHNLSVTTRAEMIEQGLS